MTSEYTIEVPKGKRKRHSRQFRGLLKRMGLINDTLRLAEDFTRTEHYEQAEMILHQVEREFKDPIITGNKGSLHDWLHKKIANYSIARRGGDPISYVNIFDSYEKAVREEINQIYDSIERRNAA